MAIHFRWLITEIKPVYIFRLFPLLYVNRLSLAGIRICIIDVYILCIVKLRSMLIFSPIFRKSYLDLIISCWLCFSFTFYFFFPIFFFFGGWVCVYVCVVVMVCFSTLLLSSNHAASYMLNFELESCFSFRVCIILALHRCP